MSILTIAVAAAQSGAGKTTVTMALIAGLRRRGLTVQPFKVGPDYLDPELLGWLAGRPCRNLDGWMLPDRHLLELFHRACRGADVAVVEGVMGLLDGRSGAGDGDRASTAAIARLLGCPVVLVVDAARASRTVGAVAHGLAAFGVACLGAIGRDGNLALPDRYLGLVSPAETEPSPVLRAALERAAEGLDLDSVLLAARRGAVRPPKPATWLFPDRPLPARVRIAVASDAAFHFYYRDSLDLLQAWGAELVPFSPLADTGIPRGVGGVYVGGGYPELFAAPLSGNAPMLASLHRAHRLGTLLYAECGGAMYLSREIEDAEGRHHRMAGLWPAAVSLRDRRLSVGYRTVRASAASFLHGFELPAHEFHYSRMLSLPGDAAPAWQVLGEPGGERGEGFAGRGLVASYIHLHLGARPGLARRLVEACAAADGSTVAAGHAPVSPAIGGHGAHRAGLCIGDPGLSRAASDSSAGREPPE